MPVRAQQLKGDWVKGRSTCPYVNETVAQRSLNLHLDLHIQPRAIRKVLEKLLENVRETKRARRIFLQSG
jgi:hypothetical protein